MRKIFAASLVVLLFIGLISCSSKFEQSKAFFEKGKKHYEANQFEPARIEFLNAIQRDPSYADAYFYLGLIAQRQGHIDIVYQMMMKASKLDNSNTKALLTVGELLVLGRQFGAAEEYADTLILQDAHLFEANRIKAAAYIGRGSYTSAEVALKKAEAIKPDDASLYGLRAMLARDLGEMDKALLYLGKAIDAGADKEHYLLLRSKIYRDQDNSLALIEDLKKLIDADPKQKEYVYGLAKIYSKLGNNQEAEQTLQAFIDKNDENFTAIQLWLDVVYLQDEKRGAESLAAMMEKFKESNVLRFYEVRRVLKQGRYTSGKAMLHELIEKNDASEDGWKARAVLAEVLLEEENITEARALVNKNLESSSGHEPSLLVLASSDIKTAQYQSAISNLHRVLRKNPESEKALVLLGRAYVESGSDLLSDDAFRQVLELNPSNQAAAIPVANNLIQGDDLARSESVIERVLARKPKDAKLLMFYVRILLLKKDWAVARWAIEQLEKLPDTQAYVAFLQGKLAQAQNQCELAVENYRAALHLKPELFPAFQGLDQCYLILEKDEEWLAFLQAYKASNPEASEVYSYTAKLYLRNKKFESSVLEIETALELQPRWEEGYVQLAGIHNELKNYHTAEETYRKAIALLPESVYLKTLLASFLESIGKKQEALVEYESLLEAHPEFEISRNNYVSLLLSGEPTKKELEQALELAQVFSTSLESRFLDTYGYALLKNDRAVEAEIVLREAAEKAPRLVEIHQHFAESLIQVERYEEARVVLRRISRYVDETSGQAASIALLMERVETGIKERVEM
ncbi:MAG: tetratricopeptide repeat protein [Agarilytica sp.]